MDKKDQNSDSVTWNKLIYLNVQVHKKISPFEAWMHETWVQTFLDIKVPYKQAQN